MKGEEANVSVGNRVDNLFFKPAAAEREVEEEVAQESRSLLKIDAKLNDNGATFIIDTGAQVTGRSSY